MKTKFTGILGKIVVGDEDTIERRLNEIFDTTHIVEGELPQDVAMELLNVLLGVYTSLEVSNQLDTRSGLTIKATLNKVVSTWL